MIQKCTKYLNLLFLSFFSPFSYLSSSTSPMSILFLSPNQSQQH